MSDIINDLNDEASKSLSQKTEKQLTKNGVASMQNDKKKKKDDLGGLTLLLKPTRRLPSLVEECLDKGFTVSLSKEGYYVSGFYGLNEHNQYKGFTFLQETDSPSVMVGYDHKNNKHVINSFEDLVKFNRLIWSVFYKQNDEYKKPDPTWFEYLLAFGAVEVTPGR